jgi:DNA polymerase-3 subunit delta
MSSPEPITFLFYGQDEPSLRDRLAGFLSAYTDEASGDFNLTRLDGGTAELGDIVTAAGTLPFLADLRVVVVENLTDSAAGREIIKKLPDMLADLPDWSRLAFVETGLGADSPRSGGRRKAIKALANAVEGDPRGRVLAFELPEERDRPAWIKKRAAQYGAKLTDRAAYQLAERIGEDLILADSEIVKLATYAGDQPIDAEDVDALTPYTPEANIFNMVDALGQRRGDQALQLLRQLLDDGDEPLRVYGMIIRQYRLLIQMKEQLNNGLNASGAARNMGVHPFVAKKLNSQASYYSAELLEDIYRRLLEVDLEIKTGQTDPELALEMLIALLAGQD